MEGDVYQFDSVKAWSYCMDMQALAGWQTLSIIASSTVNVKWAIEAQYCIEIAYFI